MQWEWNGKCGTDTRDTIVMFSKGVFLLSIFCLVFELDLVFLNLSSLIARIMGERYLKMHSGIWFRNINHIPTRGSVS